MIFLLAIALLIPLFVGWYTRKKADRLAKLLMNVSIFKVIFVKDINTL
jgi:hypothetical protein